MVNTGVEKPVVKRSPCCLSQCVLYTVAVLWNPPVFYLRHMSTPKPKDGCCLHFTDEKIRIGRGEVLLPGAQFSGRGRVAW